MSGKKAIVIYMIMVISLFTIFFIVNNIQNNKRHKVFKQYSVNGFCFQVPKAIIKNTEQIKRQDTSISYEDNVTKFYAKDISKEDTINSSVDIADYVSKNDSIELSHKTIGEINKQLYKVYYCYGDDKNNENKNVIIIYFSGKRGSMIEVIDTDKKTFEATQKLVFEMARYTYEKSN